MRKRYLSLLCCATFFINNSEFLSSQEQRKLWAQAELLREDRKTLNFFFLTSFASPFSGVFLRPLTAILRLRLILGLCVELSFLFHHSQQNGMRKLKKDSIHFRMAWAERSAWSSARWTVDCSCVSVWWNIVYAREEKENPRISEKPARSPNEVEHDNDLGSLNTTHREVVLLLFRWWNFTISSSRLRLARALLHLWSSGMENHRNDIFSFEVAHTCNSHSSGHQPEGKRPMFRLLAWSMILHDWLLFIMLFLGIKSPARAESSIPKRRYFKFIIKGQSLNLCGPLCRGENGAWSLLEIRSRQKINR